MCTSVTELDTLPFCRCFPSYDGFIVSKEKGENKKVVRGIQLAAAGWFLAKVVAISTLITASSQVCALWMLADLVWITFARVFVFGGWRSFLPGAKTKHDLLHAVALHVILMMMPAPSLRVIYGPIAYAYFLTYFLISNFAMVAAALYINPEIPRWETVPTELLWAALGFGILVFLMGVAVAMVSMPPRYRATFWTHDTLEAYVSRVWEYSTTGSAGMGNNSDAARAKILVAWNSHYWCVHHSRMCSVACLPTNHPHAYAADSSLNPNNRPRQKVRDWLMKWPEWQQKDPPPPWFTPKV